MECTNLPCSKIQSNLNAVNARINGLHSGTLWSESEKIDLIAHNENERAYLQELLKTPTQ
jgi:hypothetical protein